MLACERQDTLNLNVVPVYKELMIHLAQAETGVQYSGFNSLAEYEQDLRALGFPDLLEPMLEGDFEGLKDRCVEFDQVLRKFLAERWARLNAFETVEELEEWLE